MTDTNEGLGVVLLSVCTRPRTCVPSPPTPAAYGPFIPRRFLVCDLHVPGAAASTTPVEALSAPPGGQTSAPPVVREAGLLEEASFRPFRLTGREYVARDFLQLTFALPSESEARGPFVIEGLPACLPRSWEWEIDTMNAHLEISRVTHTWIRLQLVCFILFRVGRRLVSPCAPTCRSWRRLRAAR